MSDFSDEKMLLVLASSLVANGMVSSGYEVKGRDAKSVDAVVLTSLAVGMEIVRRVKEGELPTLPR